MCTNSRPQQSRHCLSWFKCPTSLTETCEKEDISLEVGRHAGHISRPGKVYRRLSMKIPQKHQWILYGLLSSRNALKVSTSMFLPRIHQHASANHSATVMWGNCNGDVRQLSRRKRRAYKEERDSKTQSDWKRYRQIQKDKQNACWNSHNNYIRNMISEPGSKNKKHYSCQGNELWQLRCRNTEKKLGQLLQSRWRQRSSTNSSCQLSLKKTAAICHPWERALQQKLYRLQYN